MKHPSPYLKMRVLGAIEFAEGRSLIARIRQVSGMPFVDEDGHRRQFTWRTIQTWYARYKKHGVTSMDIRPRADKGKRRKLSPEEIHEAVSRVLPLFHKDTVNKMQVYPVRKGSVLHGKVTKVK